MKFSQLSSLKISRVYTIISNIFEFIQLIYLEIKVETEVAEDDYKVTTADTVENNCRVKEINEK